MPGYVPVNSLPQVRVAEANSAINYVNSFGKLNDDNWLDVLRAKAQTGDAASMDKYYNYMMSEASAQSAREYETKRNSEAYQTLVNDLKKAGINPYWIDSGFSVPSYTNNSHSYSDSSYMSARKQDETEKKNMLSFISKLAGFAGSFGSALAYMMFSS